MGKPRLPYSIMYRICKEAGASRMSRVAAKVMAKELEEIAKKIAKEAIDYAMHARRKTIKAQDIEIAAKKVLAR